MSIELITELVPTETQIPLEVVTYFVIYYNTITKIINSRGMVVPHRAESDIVKGGNA